jgi:hypothetical protein
MANSSDENTVDVSVDLTEAQLERLDAVARALSKQGHSCTREEALAMAIEAGVEAIETKDLPQFPALHTNEKGIG